MPGACRGGALQLLRPAVGQAICRQPAEALGCCVLRLAPAPWLTCTALCPLAWAWLWFAQSLVLHCCQCRCVLVLGGGLAGLLFCLLCRGRPLLLPCCLVACTGLAWCGMVWCGRGHCCPGAMLAVAGLLGSMPCLLLSYLRASPSPHTCYRWQAFFPLPRLAPHSMSCFGRCPLASSAFPLPGWTLH